MKKYISIVVLVLFSKVLTGQIIVNQANSLNVQKNLYIGGNGSSAVDTNSVKFKFKNSGLSYATGGPFLFDGPFHAMLTQDYPLDTTIDFTVSRMDSLHVLRVDKNGVYVSAESNAGKSNIIASNSGVLLLNGIPNSGNVGIGTLAPTGKLDVADQFGNVNFTVNNSNVSYLRFNGGDDLISLDGNNHQARIVTNDNNYYQQESGLGYFMNMNVGIGTANPTQLLTVNGNNSDTTAVIYGGLQTQSSIYPGNYLFDTRYTENSPPYYFSDAGISIIGLDTNSLAHTKAGMLISSSAIGLRADSLSSTNSPTLTRSTFGISTNSIVLSSAKEGVVLNPQIEISGQSSNITLTVGTPIIVASASGVNINANINASSDIYINDSTRGLILTSPDGTPWRITVDNAGVISATVVP